MKTTLNAVTIERIIRWDYPRLVCHVCGKILANDARKFNVSFIALLTRKHETTCKGR